MLFNDKRWLKLYENIKVSGFADKCCDKMSITRGRVSEKRDAENIQTRKTQCFQAMGVRLGGLAPLTPPFIKWTKGRASWFLDSMLEPILFALSDMSVSARFAFSAAALVSPSKDCSRDAEKLVTVSIYSFADSPAVLYALFAYSIPSSWLSLKSVSTPPTSCSYPCPTQGCDCRRFAQQPASEAVCRFDLRTDWEWLRAFHQGSSAESLRRTRSVNSRSRTELPLQ